MMLSLISLTLLSLLISPSLAQTSTACDPTKKQCPDDPALGIQYTWNMTNTTLDTSQNVWNIIGPGVTYGNNSAMFVSEKKGDAPTIMSSFYIFWGTVSIIMKASHGQGMVSAVTLLSDDLDEIDWEFLGAEPTQVQTNYFGKGNNQTTDRGANITVTNPQDDWHNYTLDWNQDRLLFMIDSEVKRTLTYADADGNGTYYPQSPMQVKLGLWSGGDSDSPGTVSWAGGVTDYTKGPFTMSISSVTVNDGQRNVSSYSYGDQTGSFKSIKMASGQSPSATTLTQPPPESINQKFNNLSTGAKIAIFASIGGVLLILTGVCACCCVRQRKAGRRERALADAEWDKSNAELISYKNRIANGGFGFGRDSIPLSPNPQYAAAGGNKF